jgi:hypothetical protein
MRFLNGGPSIPDELLIARDEGRVVFFCGAGVSRARAGLSDFFGLAQRVIDGLGVMTDSPARRIVEEARAIESRTGVSGPISADRVFGLLERDFLARDIEAAVANALKPSPAADLSAHRIMLDLARGPDAKVRLVTTNFDLLFESCDKALRSWRPPRLPDSQRYEELEGIIHLHGRVNENYSRADGDGFVLSSSEFGRAYLSEGWAVQFIRSILDRYFVVFVGYTADDPPVQYLLEALNRSLGSRDGIYAFQSGSTSDAQARWLHKGVQPIAYEAAENHKALWDTLAAWAIRAQNPEVWYESVIALARKGPESLLPHERGQVAHVVSTLEGIRRFSASDEPPPAEWLCVFDPWVRYSRPGRLGSSSEEGPYFDPFNAYGLDSDPVPPRIAPEDSYTKREVPDNVWDCFVPTRFDRQNLRDDHFAALRGHWAVHVPSLPARIGQLGVWIQKVSHQPAAVWWASGQVGLHPDIQAQVRFGLERAKKTSSPEIRKAWRYIFEAWETPRGDFHQGWFRLKASIDLDGWTNAAVRELALIYRPYLTAERPFGGGPKPPENGRNVSLRDMVRPGVKYHDRDSDVQLPDEYVASAVREFRKNLEHAVSLETELGGYGLRHLCPIEPDSDLEGESYERAYGISPTFLFYVGLFKTLIDKDRGAAKQEYLAWRIDDETIFARLRIWVCGDPQILSGIEAGHLVCRLNDRVFWDSYHQRDLMLVLAKRWPDFSPAVQTQLGRKLLDGPSPWEGEEDAKYTERRARSSLNRIHWLKSHECEFDLDINTESAKLRELAPQWQPQYAEQAAASMEARSGMVETDTDHAALLTVPLADILNKAAELSGRTPGMLVERKPFAGSASERPVRAFAALTNAAKRNDYPEWAWKTFLSAETRNSDKPRFSALIAERLSRLPPSALAEIIYPTSEWLLMSSAILLQKFPTTFEHAWAKVVSVLRSNPDCAKSSIIRGSREPDWAMEALNSPVGKLAQALMKDPQKEGVEAGKGFPPSWIRCVDELLSLEGDRRRHALVMFARKLNWFFAIDPGWTEERLISVLEEDGHDQSALWAGFFLASRVPNQQLYMVLKPRLLRLATRQSMIRHNYAQVLAAILLAGWGSVDQATGERCVTDLEMRDVLVNADDDFRSHTLWQMQQWASERKEGDVNWKAKVPVFLTEVWPRHIKAKSPRITARLLDLAFSDATTFPGIADIIMPLVTKSDREHLWLPDLRESEGNVVDQYPDKMLGLLSAVLPENVAVWPYHIEDVLERIGSADPSLLKDHRFVELKRRWNTR